MKAPCPCLYFCLPLSSISLFLPFAHPNTQKSHNQKAMKAAISLPTSTPPPSYTSNKRRAKEIKEKDRVWFFLKGENVICQSGSDVSTIKLISLEKEEKGKGKVVSAAERRRKKGQREPMLGREAGHFSTSTHSAPLRPQQRPACSRGGGAQESRRAGEPESRRIRASGVPKVSEGSREQRGAAGAAGCRGLQKRRGEEESAAVFEERLLR